MVTRIAAQQVAQQATRKAVKGAARVATGVLGLAGERMTNGRAPVDTGGCLRLSGSEAIA